MDIVEAVRWSDDGSGVRIIDQRELPAREVWRELKSVDEVCDAISTLSVRGAPAIGIAGAMGLVVSVAECAALSHESLAARCHDVAARIRATRPTAVNLGWALDRMLAVLGQHRDSRSLIDALRAEATAILEEDRAMCRSIGEHGAELI